MRQKNINLKKSIKRPSLIWISMATALLVVLIVGGVMAKYFFETDHDDGNRVGAKDLYFTIDLLGDTLDAGSLSREIHIWGGEAASVDFTVQNYFDELRKTGFGVTYAISMTAKDKDGVVKTSLNLTLTDASNADAIGNNHSIAGNGENEAKYSLSIPKGYAEGDVVTVTVKATEPYTKEMTLQIVLHAAGAPVLYRIEDKSGSPYAELIIMANVPIEEEKLKVDFSEINRAGNDKNLQVDTTNDYLLDKFVGYGQDNPNNLNGNCLKTLVNTQAIKEKESISIFLFKADPDMDYSTAKDANGKYIDLTDCQLIGGVYTITLGDSEGGGGND